MTLRNRKKVATTLVKIVKGEFTNAAWHRLRLRDGLRRLAAQAQRMGIVPEDVLTAAGRDALLAIARAIVQESPSNPSLGAEWGLVMRLAEPEFSIEEQELFAS